jgi:hypothetical protein
MTRDANVDNHQVMRQKNTAKLPSRKSKGSSRIKLKRPKPKSKEKIIIDADLGLVFDSEAQMLEYFEPVIDRLVEQYKQYQDTQEILVESVTNLEELLDICLDDPDEVWMLPEVKDQKHPIFSFIRHHQEQGIFHVALAHVDSHDEPTFIYFQFLTRDPKVVEYYRSGRMVFDQTLNEIEFGMLEGDALSEGDPLAVGLFQAMLKLRGENDIPHEKFQELGLECRDRTIEEADEIWRSQDSSGQILVTFIREFPDHAIKDLFYLVVTLQEPNSGVHALLFSFPTNDESLVERFRHGENLQAEEVAQESSH